MTQNKRFFIQVTDVPGSGQVSPEMSIEEFVEGTNEKLQTVATVVVEAVGPFFERLSTIAQKPSECSIEFGVNAGGEAGIPFVTKGTVGANFKVTVKWSWGQHDK